jgi:adenylate cyclase
MNNIEIERKFLLETLPDDIEHQPHNVIRQGYIVTESSNEVRVRAKGENYYLTIKQGSGLSRNEVEIAISEDQFSALWGLTANKRIEKIRYDYQGLASLIEIDVYTDGLSPLKVAEVEFASVEESSYFEAPSFFGREVTEDKSYKNAALAVNGMPDSYEKGLI